MNAASTKVLIERYYAAFNAGDWAGMLACLSDDIAHDINQGARQVGKAAFRDFLAHMDRCYSEQLSAIVVMVSEDGRRAGAEFTVTGTYKATDSGLPPATGQTYVLPAGTFFEISESGITRVTTYYNLQDWLRQVGA